MKCNTTISLGGIVIIEKIEKRFGLFSSLFGDVEGKMKNFIPLAKLLTYNKLTHSVSIHQIINTYPEELMGCLGMKETPSERTLYRTLERIRKHFPVFLYRYQNLIKKYEFVDSNQVIDFSSTYLEGEKSELGEFGYSRDKRPDKHQINFGIATGINGIPTAITIQKGNVQDKKHMKEILKLIPKVIPKNSILIFDAGANTRKNKNKIRDLGYNYLTLKPKKVSIYRKFIQYFDENLGNVEHLEINNKHYYCVKKIDDENVFYIFFSPELYETQIKIKERKFERQKEKGNKTLKKRKTRNTTIGQGMGRTNTSSSENSFYNRESLRKWN